MKKREYIYVHKPHEYEIRCDICGGDNLDWSEFESKIWCYDCGKDTCGTGGLFKGSMAIGLCELLGLSLDRIDLKTGDRLYLRVEDDSLKWERR